MKLSEMTAKVTNWFYKCCKVSLMLPMPRATTDRSARVVQRNNKAGTAIVAEHITFATPAGARLKNAVVR